MGQKQHSRYTDSGFCSRIFRENPPQNEVKAHAVKSQWHCHNKGFTDDTSVEGLSSSEEQECNHGSEQQANNLDDSHLGFCLHGSIESAAGV